MSEVHSNEFLKQYNWEHDVSTDNENDSLVEVLDTIRYSLALDLSGTSYYLVKTLHKKSNEWVVT